MKKPAKPAVVIPGGPNRPVPVKAPAGHHQAKPRQTPAQARKAHRARVAAARKGAATRKKTAAKRKLALGEAVACCAAEALAASLRLAGGTVSDADVLALYRRTADGPDAGATIGATLEAAQRFGLGGSRPAAVAPWLQEVTPLGVDRPWATGRFVLGLELPEGPHAVTVGPDGAWWSWGEPYDPAGFPGAVIEEAWEVTWQ